MRGKAYNEDDTSGPDRSFSLVYVLSSCWDFAHEKTALEELVEARDHILRMCVKGHPEIAGVGVEYGVRMGSVETGLPPPDQRQGGFSSAY